MRNRKDSRDLDFLRNQIDLINLRLDDLSSFDDRKTKDILRRLGQIEDRLTKQKSILNAGEAAEYLHISVPQVYRLVKSGLPHYRNGRRYYFERGRIDEWLIESARKSMNHDGDENNA
jgi:excisionase family DNA binding protein